MQVARVGKRCQDADERQPLGVLGATRGRSSESARLAVQQAVQQVWIIDSKDLFGHNGEETTNLWLIISKDLIGQEFERPRKKILL